jgi:pilus assembly protein TadC
MSPEPLAGALVLAAVVIACGARWRGDRERLGRVVAPAKGSPPTTPAGAVSSEQRGRARPVAAGVAVGVGIALLVGGWAGPLVGVVLGGMATFWLRRQVPAATREEQRRIEHDLPYAADLIGAALRAGARPETAVEVVGTAIGGPLGERLLHVGRALRLGSPPAEAWARLGERPAAIALARAAVRGQHSGAAFAEALRRQADDLRAGQLTAADAAGRRAAVLIVLPLGLCFLPAFVLAGLVPVIVAVLGDVLPP